MNVNDLNFSKTSNEIKNKISNLIKNYYKKQNKILAIVIIVLVILLFGMLNNYIKTNIIGEENYKLDFSFLIFTLGFVFFLSIFVCLFISNYKKKNIIDNNIEIYDIRIKYKNVSTIHDIDYPGQISKTYTYHIETLDGKQIYYKKRKKDFINIDGNDRKINDGDYATLIKYQVKSRKTRYNYVIISTL